MTESRDQVVAEVFTRWLNGEYGLDPENLIAGAVDAAIDRLEHDAAVSAEWTAREIADAPDFDPEAVALARAAGERPDAGSVVTHCAVPADGVPISVVEVVSYLDGEGNSLIAVRHAGDPTLSGPLGLFEAGKAFFLRTMLGTG